MNVSIDDNKKIVIVKDIKDFHPDHALDCGQAFRWVKEGDSYTGVVKDQVVEISLVEGDLIIQNCDSESFNELWRDYLDLDKDYSSIKEVLSKDNILKEAINHGWGIRILNQEPWETLISFIISSNNGIVRIKKIIDNLSKKYGKEIPYQGKIYYSFPRAEDLARATLDDLRALGTGYRDKYIKNTAIMVNEGNLDLNSLIEMDYESAKEELLKFPGVGPKVADCVLLFSLRKEEAFPVDVWIKRIIEHLYFKNNESSITNREVSDFAKNKYASLAGIAQQYLFYYARELQIGK